MIEIEEADHVSLYELLVAYFSLMNLPLENMIAIGTDGGSNLCGAQNSLYTLLKEKIPNLQLIKCVCHSLNLVASSAADEFPSSVEFLLREVYNWFSNSSLCRAKYMRLWSALNAIDEIEGE